MGQFNSLVLSCWIFPYFPDCFGQRDCQSNSQGQHTHSNHSYCYSSEDDTPPKTAPVCAGLFTIKDFVELQMTLP